MRSQPLRIPFTFKGGTYRLYIWPGAPRQIYRLASLDWLITHQTPLRERLAGVWIKVRDDLLTEETPNV